MSIVQKLIETQEFATLPPVAAKVLKLLENDSISVNELSAVIETDATLTLKLLRVANSPLYAMKTEVHSIHQAILTLGLNRLTNIVLGVSIFSKFLMSSQKQAAQLMEKFWWHASCTGMVAKSLAKKIKRSFKENEFIGGLLHDIGKLAMLQYDSVKYNEVVDLVLKEGIFDIEAEQKVFGVSHPEVGIEIARLWKLPEELIDIIGYHSEPGNAHQNKDLISIVRLSDILCEIWGADFYEGFRMVEVSKEESWKLLTNSIPDLDKLDVEIFTLELEEDFIHSTDFLNIIKSDGK